MLSEVSVVGAGGKMGRGIALVVLQEMALQTLSHGKVSKLHLVDSLMPSLEVLRPFLREHLKKFGEKKINLLRRQAASNPHLVSNAEIITAFVEGGMDCLWFHKEVYSSKLVFEAVTEDIAVKTELFKQLDSELILSNTSSIPIHLLQEKSGRTISGFHFYNPPHTQKLVELAFAKNASQTLREQVYELVKVFHKISVESKDVAGFIGNGHFIRELNFACRLVEELAKSRSLPDAVYMVNKITGEYLLRPMGIFDLVDFIGFDTCEKIAAVMSLPSPKFNIHPTDANAAECDKALGPLPEGYFPWKQLTNDPKKSEKVAVYLHSLSRGTTWGGELAKQFLNESQAIGKKLVSDGVAHSLDDLNTVLIEGFHHLYGVPK